MFVTRAITVRLDEADHAALEKQAEQLRIRPGTLARILVHAGLSADAATVGNPSARAALDRLVSRSQKRASADAVGLVAEARVALEPNR
jgi:hypothetical protein